MNAAESIAATFECGNHHAGATTMFSLTDSKPHVNDQAIGTQDSRKQAILCDPANKPNPPFFPENIPAELRVLAQWIAWEFVWIPGRNKWDKLPTDPNSGRPAKANNPETWGTFALAIDCARR